MASRFEKFSERARRVLTLAQEEAQQLNHNYIDTEHILLGLAREDEGVAAKVLGALGVSPNKVRTKVDGYIGHSEKPATGETGLTPRAKRVIELAIDEARHLGQGYIGTEHLLLGLMREGEGAAAEILESLNVTLERVRTETIRIINESSPRKGGGAARTASRTSAKVRMLSRFPTRTTLSSVNPASILAICRAKALSANTSPRRGPVWVNMRVRIVRIP